MLTNFSRNNRFMKRLYRFLLLVILLSACNPAAPAPTNVSETPGTAAVTATPGLPTPLARVTHAPDAKTSAQAFLDAWMRSDTAGMYALLTEASRGEITQEAFTKYYSEFSISLTLQSVSTEIYGVQTEPQTAKAAFRAKYATALFGDLERQNELSLVKEFGDWRIMWNDGLGMPELRGGNSLSLELSVPERGDIQASSGDSLAENTQAVAFSIIPGNVSESAEGTMLDALGYVTGKIPNDIRLTYEDAGPDWYISAGETSQEIYDSRADLLNSFDAVQKWPYGPGRFYPWGGVGPHVTGYVQYIPREQLDQYLRDGFRVDERVGASGLEKWGQDILTGTRGANLYLKNSSGSVVERITQVAEEPGQTIVTTLNMTVQRQAQAAIREFRGAVVVLERDTGRVLAMVSSPGFDPNLFDANNYNTQMGELSKMLSSASTPLVNRATGDQASGYPLGSVFKIIDMAAALESGLFTAESTYDCQYEFNEIIGRTYYDWTLEKEKPPSGLLTLPQGLMRSCNPWFYHIGLELFRNGRGTDIANMARGFGLGSPTGIEVLPEIAGNVPEPNNEVEAVEQAIGQGELLVTPLQVANFVAAVGNGGTLYRPQVIEKTIKADGTETQVFAAEEHGKLPVKPENLELIQDAMRQVIVNERGTAYDVLGAFRIPVWGKTGTAQSDLGVPHAWFAAYTNAPTSGLPDIAVAVVAEYGGEGSEIAAPVARRVIEAYYFGRPTNLYPWESSYWVRRTATPTPGPGEETETPTP